MDDPQLPYWLETLAVLLSERAVAEQVGGPLAPVIIEAVSIAARTVLNHLSDQQLAEGLRLTDDRAHLIWATLRMEMAARRTKQPYQLPPSLPLS